ncbi:MAG: YitT family protein [Erysipelotrichaceae bacterium]|nr:YitT family protein [Erysipelotrichaceae bacterium]
MKTVKKILICLLGCLMLGGGMGCLIRVGIGSDSLSCFYEGLSLKTNISVGTVSLLMNLLYCVVVFFLDKKKIGVSTFLFMIFGKYPIDFFYEHFFTPDSLIVAILLDIVICLVIGVGCAVIIAADLGITAYDSLTLSTSEVLKKNYVVVRYIYDGAFLLAGILLGGTFGIATIIALIEIGPVFNYAKKILVK